MNNHNRLKLNVSFIGPDLVLLNNWLNTQAVISIHNMAVHIHGPINISNNLLQYSLMEFYSCILLITGLITISKNTAVNVNVLHNCIASFQGQINISENYIDSTMSFKISDVSFDEKIIFISNKCTKIITIESEFPYIKVMQHANITFTYNEYLHDLIEFGSNLKHNNPYPFCVFQYIVTKGNLSTVTAEDYTVIFNKNVQKVLHSVPNECMLTFIHFTSHCKWLPTSVFCAHNPGVINQQIIQIDKEINNHHAFVCLSNLQPHHDCGIDTLGTVYPGQKLQVTLFTPCSDSNSVVFAETHNNLLPSTACKIAHQTELLYSINNYSRTVTSPVQIWSKYFGPPEQKFLI